MARSRQPMPRPPRRRTPELGSESRYWFSDREIGKRRRSSIGYSSHDFRMELARSQKRISRLTFVSIIVAILAGIAIVGLFFQMIQ